MRALALFPAAVVAFLLLATVLRMADVLVGSPDATRTGTATVTSCAEYGPVGRWGLGVSFGCSAEVRWTGGGTERVVFPPGQLAPDERDVPVFESGREPGRNDSARWFLAGHVAAVAMALLTLWFTLGALGSLVRVRPARRGERPDPWPVTGAEVAATPVTRRVRRLRLFAWAGLGAGLLEVLASVPLFDAPRRLSAFVSPWPELERAWLVAPPAGLVTGVGAGFAVLAGLVASAVHRDAARVLRHGQPYLEARRPRTGGTSWVPAAVVAALAGWAVVSAVRALPADAPAYVVLAGARDALFLVALLVIMLRTRQSAQGMVDQLMAERGTARPVPPSNGT
ncbi:DUF6346 domain-containing protein [Actinophytocola xanthii]|uniref:Uncharacterized protein n=1 Tax=Actinophytocola xanthii TaxID=1912961 RepID=A0A1Q8CPM0_9PSEU|nr:DUF6346 domain-containing protein [Actinophytocola xanthii]OLF16291.1 hypothetical protein BU204_17020 [Actinophytocola xanthii]